MTWFTIDPHETGFADSLDKFDVLYKIASSLGLKFVYCGFHLKNTHSDIQFIYDLQKFLGIFSNDVSVYDKEFDNYPLKEFDILDLINSKQKIKDQSNEILLIRWYWKYYEKIDVLKDIYNKLDNKYSYDFIGNYDTAQKQRDNFYIKSPFKTDKIKVAVHVRRGDISIIEINGGAYDCLTGHFSNTMKDASIYREESVVKNGIKIKSGKLYIRDEDFILFINKIKQKYNNNVEVVVCSDGYKFNKNTNIELYQKLMKYLNQNNIPFETYIDIVKKHNNVNFSLYENCTKIVGIDDQHNFKSIRALLEADIIILSQTYFASIFQLFRKNKARLIYVYQYLRGIDNGDF